MSDTALRSYYARRAAEYERVYARPERQQELRALEGALPACFAGRRVLEVACGTGWWTPHGARDAADWLATDASDETLAVARSKPDLPACVRFAQVDAYALDAIEGGYDAAFAGFWVSHIPRQRLAAWFTQLHARLAPGAQVVLIDNRWVPGASTPISRTDSAGNTYQQRTLDDGSAHEVLKNFFVDADDVLAGTRVQAAQWHVHPHYWRLAYRSAG